MMAFFIGWELWQEMTFVLACLIAIVFVIGFVKLWRTNHVLRRYELLDEEKRARLDEMQQYGIEIPAVNDIPFGSRAIQSGIEVDEIWISRPNTPVPSQRASCATVMDDSSTDGTAVAGNKAFSVRNIASDSYDKAISGIQSSPASSKVLQKSALSEQRFSESATLHSDVPSSSLPESRSEGFGRPINASNNTSQRRWSSIQSASEAGPAVARVPTPEPNSEPASFGTAEVFANTRTRRTVSGFEILPAGSLGERVELHAGHHSEELARPKVESRTPNKLQKPRPKKTSQL